MTHDQKRADFVSDAEWAKFLGEETETEVSGSSKKKTAQRKKPVTRWKSETHGAPRCKPAADDSRDSRQQSKGTSNTDYEVGYGKPPKHTQFKPGQSGNPRGRPKRKTQMETERDLRASFWQAGKMPVSIKIDGKRRKIPAFQAVFFQLYSMAIEGHGPSIRFLITLARTTMAEHEDWNARLYGQVLDHIQSSREDGVPLNISVEEIRQVMQFIDTPIEGD